MRATSGWLKGLNPVVAIVSKSLVAVFVLFGVLMTDTAAGAFAWLRDGIIATLSWYYIGLVAVTLGLTVYLMLSRFGRVHLGRDGEQPEFGNFAWISMLFAAGMGIGLVFWSIAEPITHFQDNPFIEEGQTPQAAQMAMRLTIFHWGLHPWAIYVLVALAFAYFSYRKGLPLTVRSALQPIFGERVWGPLGHAVDILAIFATTFGVATSLGLGATQINTGLNQLIGIEIGTGWQLGIVAVITAFAVTSVVSGLERGIRLLSEANLWLSIGLLVAVASLGPTAYLFDWMLQATGDYLQNVLWLSLWTDANANRGWQASWTTFYWGWWISWAPFVGMFIARISRGRTVRELILGALFAPTLMTPSTTVPSVPSSAMRSRMASMIRGASSTRSATSRTGGPKRTAPPSTPRRRVWPPSTRAMSRSTGLRCSTTARHDPTGAPCSRGRSASTQTSSSTRATR